MKFGELTIAQILLSAFSGIGVTIFFWLIGKRIISRFNKRGVKTEVDQRNNVVKGDIAGGDIVETNSLQSIDIQQKSIKVNQSDNIVLGNIAGANIVKDKDKE